MNKSAMTAVAAIMVATGLYLFAFGSVWAPLALHLLSGSEVGGWLELLIPFLPMPFIGLGAALYVSRH